MECWNVCMEMSSSLYVFEWFQRFKERCKDLKRQASSEWPRTARNLETLQISWTCSLRPSNDPRIDGSTARYPDHDVRFFITIWERGRFVPHSPTQQLILPWQWSASWWTAAWFRSTNPHSPDLEPADFFIPQSKNSPQEIFGCQEHKGKHTCQIKYSSFGCLQWLFCANFWKYRKYPTYVSGSFRNPMHKSIFT